MVMYTPLPRADIALKSFTDLSLTHLESGRSRRGLANKEAC